MRHTMALVIVAFTLVATTHRAQAQPTKQVFRVGWLSATSRPRSAPPFAAFLHGLRDLGYVEGENLR